MSQTKSHTDVHQLTHGTSAYLLQHAYNPINWYLESLKSWKKLRIKTNAIEKYHKMMQAYQPTATFLSSLESLHLPLLQHKLVLGETMIPACIYKACKLPVTVVDKALDLMDKIL